MPRLVLSERSCVADVIEHLIEIDQRRLYLDQSCRSLSSYCIERLAYSEDEAVKRVRVARLASRLPQVLGELRKGAIHLTGLFLLAQFLTQDNYDSWMASARGKSKRQIEQLIAARAPRPEVPERLAPLPEPLPMPSKECEHENTCPGPTASPARGRLEPLSVRHWSVQFTASAQLYAKIERARELLSHALPDGELASLFERALDLLIERETKRKQGAAKPAKAAGKDPQKRRPLKSGSRHVPRLVARVVWQRDGGQCTFVDSEGRRCSSRHFLTLEHRQPYALGGPPTPENICLLCRAHNLHRARQVFGEWHGKEKRNRRASPVREGDTAPRPEPPVETTPDTIVLKLCAGLRLLGFTASEVRRALFELSPIALDSELDSLLRTALKILVPSERKVGAVGKT